MSSASRSVLAFAIRATLDELKRMKSEGVGSLTVDELTLAGLREAVADAVGSPASSDSESGSSVSPRQPLLAPSQAPSPDAASLIHSVTTEGDLTPSRFELPKGSKQERWEWLHEKVLNCETCLANRNTGRQIVFGVGNLDADIFFCGEAPGEEEEKQGEPFVGPAGQKLNGMIRGMGLERDQVYIGNIMNWRPRTESGFGNRPPSPQEIGFCLPYLKAQLSIIQPKVIVALGNTAIQALLSDTSLKVGKVRGHWFEFENVPMLPTFHPSYILHNESNRTKRMVWEDLLKVMERLDLPISDKQRAYFL